jgi:hypothetical protein
MSEIRWTANDADGAAFLAGFVQISRADAASSATWVARLRAQGIAAAHPDDGWVDREQHSVLLINPYYADSLEVGGLLVLGDQRRWRVVRLTRYAAYRWGGGGRWFFEEVADEQVRG